MFPSFPNIFPKISQWFKPPSFSPKTMVAAAHGARPNRQLCPPQRQRGGRVQRRGARQRRGRVAPPRERRDLAVDPGDLGRLGCVGSVSPHGRDISSPFWSIVTLELHQLSYRLGAPPFGNCLKWFMMGLVNIHSPQFDRDRQGARRALSTKNCLFSGSMLIWWRVTKHTITTDS